MWLFNNTVRFAKRSPEWKTVRKLHLEREGCCQACNKISKLEVHHIIPVHKDRTLELDPSNLITLCDRCHLVFGHLSDYKSWNIDVVTDCETYLKKTKSRPYKN